MSKQLWPKIWLKIGPLMVITNWLDTMPRMSIDYPTMGTRATKFGESLWIRKLIGPVHWVRIVTRFEILKSEDDVTHPNFKNTEKYKRMKAEDDVWKESKKK